MKRWTETNIRILKTLYASNYPRQDGSPHQMWHLEITASEPGSRNGFFFGQLVHPCDGMSVPSDLAQTITEDAKKLPSLRDLQLAKIEHESGKISFQFAFTPLQGETFCDGAVEALIDILGLFGAKEKLQFLVRQKTKIYRNKKWIDFGEFLATKHGV